MSVVYPCSAPLPLVLTQTASLVVPSTASTITATTPIHVYPGVTPTTLNPTDGGYFTLHLQGPHLYAVTVTLVADASTAVTGGGLLEGTVTVSGSNIAGDNVNASQSIQATIPEDGAGALTTQTIMQLTAGTYYITAVLTPAVILSAVTDVPRVQARATIVASRMTL